MDLDFDVLSPEKKGSKASYNGSTSTSSNLIDLDSIPTLVPATKSSDRDTSVKTSKQNVDLPVEDTSTQNNIHDLNSSSFTDPHHTQEPLDLLKQKRGQGKRERESNKEVLFEQPSDEETIPEKKPDNYAEKTAENTELDAQTSESTHTHIHANAFSEEKLRCNPFSLIVPYCDPKTLLELTLVSHQASEAATDDSIWRPILEKIGFSNKLAEDGSLLSLTSAINVLERGYLSGDHSPYRTFVRAYNLLHNVIAEPEGAIDGLSNSDKAQVLGNAYRFARIAFEEVPETLSKTIASTKEELIDEVTTLVLESKPINQSYFQTIDLWMEKTYDLVIKEKAVELYLKKFKPSLPVEDVFTFSRDTDDEHRQVSQQKVESAFSKVTAALVQIMSDLNDVSSPIPKSWRSYTWSLTLSKFMAAIVIYVQDILETTATQISELEYLLTVPKLHMASRILSQNSVLIENADKADFNVETYVDCTIIRPILEEFCERQATYVERYTIGKVQSWNESVSQRETETEQFLWSSVPKKADKNKFISSFKWAFLSADAVDDEGDRSGGGGGGGAEESGIPNSSDINIGTEAPSTEFEAQTAVLVSKLRGMESLVSIELAIETLETCRAAIHRLKQVGRASAKTCEPLFCTYLRIVGRDHIQTSFDKAIKVLNAYDPKRYGRLLISVGDGGGADHSSSEGEEEEAGFEATGPSNPNGFMKKHRNVPKGANAVEPLAVFTELMNIGDLVQQMVHVFFEEELVGSRIVRRGDFVAPSVNAKRKFEQMLDDVLAEGLSRGIDVLMEQVDFTLRTEQLGSDYLPLPNQLPSGGPTAAAERVIDLVRSHLDLLRESTEKSLFDVFQQEVGVRLYASISKNLKRQIISIDGAINVISDMNAYYAFIVTLRQKNLIPYYETLKQISQLYLIETKYAKQIGLAISDSGRYNGLVTTEDLVELVKRRQDWQLIKPKVDKVLYGIFECIIC